MKTYKYTVQCGTDSWSFAAPYGTDVQGANNVRELRDIFDSWRDEVRRFTDEAVYLTVWKGHYNDITDIYPDFRLLEGKNGGMIKEEV